MTSVETWQEEGYQLSPQQLARSGEARGTAMRTVATAARIPVPDLEARIASAVAAHESLRTRYTHFAGLPTLVQVVDPVGPVAIERSGTDRTVFRAGALTVEHTSTANGTRLVLTLPRLSVDDASWTRLVGLLLTDAAAAAGETVLQYADVAAWLGEVLDDAPRPPLADETARPSSAPAPALPFLTPAGLRDAAAGPASATAVIEGPALERLDALAARCGVSDAAVLLALWRALYGRYCGDTDDQVLVLADGRSTEGLENVLGLLERPVPVRLETGADTPVADALRAAQDALRSAATAENETDPGTAAGRTANGCPLSYRHRADRWAEELADGAPVHEGPGALHLDCVRGPRSLRLTFIGGAGRVAQDDLDLVAEAFGHQLTDLVSGGTERALGGLRLTAPHAPGAAPEPRASYAPVLDRFLTQAERTPTRPALRCGDTVVSYRDAARGADAVAHLLREHGVRAGQRVALFVPASVDTVVAMLGVWLAGAAFVPLDPTWPRQRIDTILREAGPALLLSPGPEADHPVGVPLVRTADAVVDPGRAVPSGAAATGPAYVIFTSGTSGLPKGVVVGHEQLAHYAWAIGGTLALPEGAEFAAVSTLAADLAYTAVFPTLAGGGCVQLVPTETATSPAALTERFRSHPPAAMKLVPSHLAALLAEAAEPLALLPSEVLVLGGELLPRALYERLREIAPSLRMYNHYGPTETTVGAACLPLNTPVDDRCSSVPVGSGLGANVLTVVDAEGAALPPWCPGEVLISGPGVGLGYLARLREGGAGFGTADTADAHRTGDLGRLVPGHGIEILGRIDDQVKLRGYRVQLGEIETLLADEPGVGAAAVVARADADGLVTHLDAYLTAAAGVAGLSVDEVRAAVVLRLPAALVPTGWQVLDRFPLTRNGKLDRNALAPVAPPKARAGRPRDSVEQRLLAIWSSILDQDISSPDADFFEHGGQSLRAIKLMAQINNAFGLRLPMSAVFSAPTVAMMAELVRKSDVQDSNLVPLRAARGPREQAPVFCVHPGGGNTLSYWELARLIPADRSVYGIEAWGLHGRPPQDDFAAMAEEYAANIAAVGDAAPVIVGWCFGGIMAYATAQALRRAGREVAQLIIVNCGVPGDAESALARQPADHLMRRFAFHYQLELPPGPLGRLGHQELLKALQDVGRLPPDSGEAELRSLLDVYMTNMTALDRHFVREGAQLGRADFPVLLVRAEPADEPHDADRTWGWGSVAGPGLGFASVATTHHGIMRQPAVEELAELIRREIGA
ncbi:amino acid adenylation domain-containing protein [Streptomyces sp. NBC_00083]|uniref:amino acid adenylation domain-containing protein n=1 Tax=Streptomyces sp. NBC_00083 TaxID=2975647 RepID=UPI00225989B3|nr:amino acid adenylation domain-containing protein [Streptomyces sp. NBC_00083]MCX5386227.1 amino acid adenylation domain-containing protein [Streptomyces sp. NBC_00083]